MKKHAFIITYPGEPGADNYCKGVLKDRENIERYLLSPIGGAWRKDEISNIQPVSSLYLQVILHSFVDYDYLMFFFSGHGFHDGTSTMLELSKNKFVSERSLRGKAKKTLIILDCCRVIEIEPVMDHVLREMFKGASAGLNPTKCRALYEKYLENIPNTLTTCYSCLADQTSNDLASKGGLYLSTLIETAEEQMGKKSTDVSSDGVIITINKVHQEATVKVMKLSDDEQIPDIGRQKLNTDFPFVVIA